MTIGAVRRGESKTRMGFWGAQPAFCSGQDAPYVAQCIIARPLQKWAHVVPIGSFSTELCDRLGWTEGFPEVCPAENPSGRG